MPVTDIYLLCACSSKSLAIDQENMRPVVDFRLIGIGALNSLRCFYAVVLGFWPVKITMPLIPKGFLLELVKEENYRKTRV